MFFFFFFTEIHISDTRPIQSYICYWYITKVKYVKYGGWSKQTPMRESPVCIQNEGSDTVQCSGQLCRSYCSGGCTFVSFHSIMQNSLLLCSPPDYGLQQSDGQGYCVCVCVCVCVRERDGERRER